MRRTIEDVIEIGKALIRQQQALSRSFQSWIVAEFDMSQTAAYRVHPCGGAVRWALFPGYAALFTHERVVSVDLTGKSRPARGEIFENLGFSLILR
jgi:hypothetical protein